MTAPTGVRSTRFSKFCSRMHYLETARWRRRNRKAASFRKQQISGRRRALRTAEMGYAAVSRSTAEETQLQTLVLLSPLLETGHSFTQLRPLKSTVVVRQKPVRRMK
jgi:hypothetical protein